MNDQTGYGQDERRGIALWQTYSIADGHVALTNPRYVGNCTLLPRWITCPACRLSLSCKRRADRGRRMAYTVWPASPRVLCLHLGRVWPRVVETLHNAKGGSGVREHRRRTFAVTHIEAGMAHFNV